MRGLWLGLVGTLALAGCDDGVVIEVRTPGATDEVELFLGVEECGDCPGVSPSAATGTVPLPGRVFFRDDSGNANRYTARASGGVARFHIKPSDVGQELLTLAAFARGTAVSATLLTDIDLMASPQRYVVELAPARETLPPPVPPDGTYVAVWEQPNTTPASACFAVERWQGQAFGGRAFIVPKDDPDCDGFTSETGNECNPYVANGTAEPEIEAETACLVADEPSPGVTTCRVGGPACADGSPNETTACAPSSYCVPNLACTSCMSPTDPLHTCLPALKESKPRLFCTLPMTKSSDATHLDACTDARSFTTDLSQQLGSDCAADDTPFAQPDGNTGTTFISELKFPTTVADGAGLVVKMKREERCTYRVSWDGDASFEAAGQAAFVRFVVEPTGQPGVRLLMPILVQPTLVASCETAEPTCTFQIESTPDLFGCLPR